jgi:hypothetical protein
VKNAESITKDSLATHQDLGLDTTTGSFALVDSGLRNNTTVVDRGQSSVKMIRNAGYTETIGL